MKIAGVVVLYNPNKKTLDNVRTYINFLEVLYVVDNSKDNHFHLFSNMKKVKYIFNDGNNLGIATALNIAAKRAISEKFNWLLTMDQDSFFEKDEYIKRLIDHVENNADDNLAIVSPYHYLKEDNQDFPRLVEETIVMTSGNIINLDIYNKIHGFKDWLFIDFVDYDYCLKLLEKKYKILVIKDVLLNHNLGNIKKIKVFNKNVFVTNHNYIRRYFIARNRLYLNKIHGQKYPKICKNELKNTYKEMIKIILFEKDKWRKIKFSLFGIRDYYMGIKGVPKFLKGVI